MKNKNFVFAILFAFALVACGGETTENQTEKKDDVKTENKENKGAETGDKSKCGETTVSFSSPQISGEGFAIKYAAAKLFMMQSDGKQYPMIRIDFTNYERKGSYIQNPATEGEVQLGVTFNGLTGKEIEAGTYNIANEGFGKDLNVGGGMQTTEKTGYFSSPEGSGQITYLSADKICGTVDIKSKDGLTFIKGSFSVALER